MITHNLELAVTHLKSGEVVGIPTETVYGLAANALDPLAVAKVYELKKRPVDHPLIVHVAELKEVIPLVKNFPDAAKKLAREFWPGPLTLIFQKSERVPDLTTGGMDTIAIRIPQHPLAIELIRKCGFPLAAPSANPFGRISPTTAQHVEKSLGSFGHKAPLILDGGTCSVGLESTILSFLENRPCVLRLGGLPVEKIEKLVGSLAFADKSQKSIAPGMLPQHYAPRTPLMIGDLSSSLPPGKLGLLCLKSPPDTSFFSRVEILSPSGNLQEAAARFYGCLRLLDEADLDCIIAERFPDVDLGRALNDRLERACHLD